MMPKIRNKKKLKLHLHLSILMAFLVGGLVSIAVWQFTEKDSTQPTSQQSSAAPKTNQMNSSKAKLTETEYSTSQPSSIWVVVNKGRILPTDFIPDNLTNPNIPLTGPASSDNMKMRADAAEALSQLGSAAKTEGLGIKMTSGYRSYTTQSGLYSNYVATQGSDYADKTSARPGHSEHQTGLAVDVEPSNGQCSLSECFAETAEGKWVALHAYEYGFIVRYQKDATNKTGYAYEPWHLRYVGKDLASKLYSNHQTLEEYFGLNFYTSYPVSPLELKN